MMSCELNPHILEYIELVENGIACEEQKALAAHVRKCFETEEIYVDTEQLEKYLGLAKYFSFEKLFPWEEFLIALWEFPIVKDTTPNITNSRLNNIP